MKFKKYQKKYKKSMEEYRKNIEKLINDLKPRVDIPMAIVGFLLTVLGMVPIFAIIINGAVFVHVISSFSLVISFFCYIISFFGYMLIHKSMERDWL